MNIRLEKSRIIPNANVIISGSKSESNRLLILKTLYPGIRVDNLSNSDDTRFLQQALSDDSPVVDVHHAGTAMRFLAAYFSALEHREVILTGSDRMKQRPIFALVDALRKLGAEIHYVEQEGFPPLRIIGKKLQGPQISVRADISSQYITALLLIGPNLEKGLQLNLTGTITSRPYIEMTLRLIRQVGIEAFFEGQTITLKPFTGLHTPKTIVVESDWSSASYYYSIMALSDIGAKIQLKWFKKDSLQGDSALVDIYRRFGVVTELNDDTIMLEKKTNPANPLTFNLIDTPDLAQTIVVTALGLGLDCRLTGLHTLKIKETDRLEALKGELEKFGAIVEISDESLNMHCDGKLMNGVEVDTYNDHRMAMAFSPLALKTSLIIKDADVVSKSYPDFWKDLGKIGIQLD